MSEPLPALPHSGVALFLERVLRAEEGEALCLARVGSASPFSRGGRVPAWVALDVAAQATAALAREAGRGAGAIQRGYLVAARGVELARADFAAEEALRVEVQRTGSRPPLFLYEVRVECEEGVVLAGRINVYADGEAEPSSGGQASRKQNH